MLGQCFIVFNASNTYSNDPCSLSKRFIYSTIPSLSISRLFSKEKFVRDEFELWLRVIMNGMSPGTAMITQHPSSDQIDNFPTHTLGVASGFKIFALLSAIIWIIWYDIPIKLSLGNRKEISRITYAEKFSDWILFAMYFKNLLVKTEELIH